MGAVVREQVLRIMANGFARAGCWYRMPNCRFVTRLWALSNLNVFVWRAVMMRNPKMRSGFRFIKPQG
jgi:hypothetical protein